MRFAAIARRRGVMAVKYQIFVSSTYADLVDERQMVTRAILDMGHIPAGMEMFPAADLQQLTYIQKVIDECDYYVLIVGARYGSLDPEGVSFTEREYDYAVSTGKTVLAFLHANMDEIPLGKTDKDTAKFDRLLEFKEKVGSGAWSRCGTALQNSRRRRSWHSTMPLQCARRWAGFGQTPFRRNPQWLTSSSFVRRMTSCARN
jgi:hypothetical protein